MNWRRAVIAVGALLAFILANGIVVAFAAGFVLGVGQYSAAGIMAGIGGMIFVAPFNYLLFQRWLMYVGQEGSA